MSYLVYRNNFPNLIQMAPHIEIYAVYVKDNNISSCSYSEHSDKNEI